MVAFSIVMLVFRGVPYRKLRNVPKKGTIMYHVKRKFHLPSITFQGILVSFQRKKTYPTKSGGSENHRLKSPIPGVVGPLTNGRTLWLINGGDPNHLLTGVILQV